MKVKTRLFLGFLLIIVLLVVVSITIYTLSYINRKKIMRNEELFGGVLLLMTLKNDTFGIQESFTYIAATLEKDRYASAEKYYRNGIGIFDTLITGNEKKGNAKSVTALKKMKNDFITFYNTGKRVTDIYITQGKDAGNKIMEEFDGQSFTIMGELNKFIDAHKKTMKDNLRDIHGRFAFMDIIVLIVTLISIFISLILTFLISSSITKPIMRVTKAISELKDKKGDLTTRIEITRRDEIGIMAEYFNQFLMNFRNMVVRLKNVSKLNMEVKTKLLGASEETASASNEIVSTIESLRLQIEKLNDGIEEVVKAVDIFSSVTEGLDNEIESMASATEESTSSIEEMIASINNVSDIVNNKTEAVDKLVNIAEERGKISESLYDNIQRLLKLVDEVSSIAEIIKAIANQTNLLSMNAAIEAAHAGEAGKGFAVVADEIRKLAETSNDNANQITSIIERVVSGITQVSKGAGENSEAFRTITEGIVSISNAFSEINSNTSELSIGGKQILEAMTELREISIRVKDGSVEMKDGISNISDSIQLISSIANGILNGMNEINIGAKDINNSMVKVAEFSREIDKSVQTMDSELNQLLT